MLVFEHDEPWKALHDYALIMERLLCAIDHGKTAMIFLEHGKPTVVSITR